MVGWFVRIIFFFLGPHLQHMEVPRLEVSSDLQLPAYTIATAQPDLSHICDLHCSSQQWRFLTHWAGPEIKPTSSSILVGFLTCWATRGTPIFGYCFCFFAGAWCGISVPKPGIEPGPQPWKRQVLTTRPPGNSLTFGCFNSQLFSKVNYIVRYSPRNLIPCFRVTWAF